MEDIKIKIYSDDSSSEHDDFDYNVKEEEHFFDNFIESKNIKIQNWFIPEENSQGNNFR